MSRHAQALGYDALILFLDERVLRLASHAADSAFVSRESQKIVKLVEATLSIRPIPIVSFIHRSIYLRCPSPPLRKASLSCTWALVPLCRPQRRVRRLNQARNRSRKPWVPLAARARLVAPLWT